MSHVAVPLKQSEYTGNADGLGNATLARGRSILGLENKMHLLYVYL
jgi:hypothetical protein